MSHNVSDHAHPMHRGPHHDKYIHADNKVSVSTSMKGSHELGDRSHLSEMKGEPHGADVTGHHGKMKW
jgi:hypothetical protein